MIIIVIGSLDSLSWYFLFLEILYQLNRNLFKEPVLE